MKIYQVIEDLGDGDCAIRNFKSDDEAHKYITNNEEYCYHESNPRVLDTENIQWSNTSD
jgi:hypothetical protein